MNLGVSSKLGLRLGLVMVIFIASNSGCSNPPKTQSTQTLSNRSLYPTSTVEATVTAALLLQPSSVPTIQLSSSLDATALPSGIGQEMLRQIDKEEAVSVLRQLTGEEPICIDTECYTIKNRVTGSEGLRWAKDYLYRELVSLGYSVQLDDWSISGYADQNIIARKVGLLHPTEEVYFVAHTDGVKKIWALPFPAADDNASGVVDLLKVARVASNYSFDRTLVFFCSTGEEQGTLGVQNYLNQLSPEKLSSIKYVINVDMVGYDDDGDGAMELWYGDDPASFALIQLMNETIRAYHLDVSPEFVVGCC